MRRIRIIYSLSKWILFVSRGVHMNSWTLIELKMLNVDLYCDLSKK